MRQTCSDAEHFARSEELQKFEGYMKIEVRDPQTPFDFGQATTAWFNTSGGKDYALRLWVWHTALIFVALIITVPFILPAMAEFAVVSWEVNRVTFTGGTPEYGPFLQAMGSAGPAYLLFIVAIWIASAMGEAAFYRKYLTSEEPARIPVRFNQFTLRNMLAQIGFYLLWIVLTFFLTFIVTIITAIFGFIHAILAAIVGLFAFIALFAFMFAIYPVRFAAAAALTALAEKTHVFAAKDITKNRFWGLLGAYIVTYIGGYIAYYIVYIIVLIAVSGNPDIFTAMSGLSTENPRATFDAMFARLSNPLVILTSVLGLAALAAAWSGWMLWIAGVSAYAVRLWQNDDPSGVFD
jgi:hypothetical protein